jgi:hypothetical protein
MDTKIMCLKGCTSCLDLYRRTAPISPPLLLPHANSSSLGERSSTSGANEPAWCSCFTRTPSLPMWRRPHGWVCTLTQAAMGGSDGPRVTSPGKMSRDGGVNPGFPPLDDVLVKAVACELVAETTPPLRRQSLADVTGRAPHALGQPISRSTVWRILATDALKPWRYKYGSFPRDPHVAEKAGPILEL